ncbi:MAG: DNA methyltransferase [Candidatus Omnitrophica bacterium]|nr:DNA methyltransferase [Candidatus Omnitrophota bacterium]MDD5610948.1 DNA methyltransferase [Candidatus Omnitrophota bacterium]
MKIQKIHVSEINPAPYNPRVDLKPGDSEYDKLKQSIVTFGYVEPLVWNERSKTLISGHQRLKILKEQGIQEVEVSVVDLPLEKEKALNIALNKIEGRWDEDKLANLLSELNEMPEFDVGLTGFDAPEISELLDNYSEVKEDDNFDFDACLESIKEPITKEGDLIQLGPHRIFCGDAGNPEQIKLLLGNEKINLLNMDPPYNVNYYGGNRPQANARPKKHKLWDKIYSDDLSQEQYEQWLKDIFANINPYFTKGAPAYIWNGHRQFGPMYLMLTELGFHVSCVITWAKERFAIGYGDYNQQTEFCLYGWKEDNGSHIWHGPNNESTLWEVHRDLTRDYIHPTQKPIALAQRAIRNSSKRSDLVLDCFLGSGSTLIAAESLKRRCFGLEIDPRYCDAIVRRYIAFVGKENIAENLKEKYTPEASHGRQ